MAKNFVVGFDVGTQNIRIGISNAIHGGELVLPKIEGSGIYPAKGLHNGYVSEKEELVEALKHAKNDIEKRFKFRIKKTLVSVGGIGLNNITVSAETAVSKGDSEITELDVERLSELCEENIPKQSIINRKILHSIPLSYKIDGKPTPTGNPIGMKGVKLEAKYLFITVLEQHLNNLVDSFEEAGIEVSELVAGPIAAGMILLSKRDRRVGCALVNIGAETVSIVVYENGIPVSLEIIPAGSNNITNDIALGLKISLEEADHIKQGGLTTTVYPKKKLEEIIDARLSDIFDMVDSHLRKIGRSGLLPAGITFSGSGSQIFGLEELARGYLNLPTRIGMIPNKNSKESGKDSSWASVYGLCLIGLGSGEDDERMGMFLRKVGLKLKKTIKRFMP